MTQAWVVAREEGQYSEYQMVIVAVHDSEEAAKEDAAARQRPIDDANEEMIAYQRALSEQWGIDTKASRFRWAGEFWDRMKSEPDAYREHNAREERWSEIPGWSEGGRHSVHGPFDVVPWKVVTP